MRNRMFTIKLREATVQVCRAALAQINYPESSDEGILAKHLKGRILTTGNLQLNMGEAIVLQEVVEDCARDHLREGSDLHNEALMFAGALSDRCRTEFHDEKRIAQWAKGRLDDFLAKEDLNKAIATANAAEASASALSDAMLREIFMGAPRKKLNIWGQTVEEPGLSRDELRAKVDAAAELKHQENIRKAGACLQYSSSIRIKLTGKPEKLARPPVPAPRPENPLMKAYRESTNVSEGVVCTVSDFMKLPR